MKRFREKSGASAEDVDDGEDTAPYDLYKPRWEYAEHMNFYIPACARAASTISVGNSGITNRLKRKRPTNDATTDDDNVSTVFLLFPSIVYSCFENQIFSAI